MTVLEIRTVHSEEAIAILGANYGSTIPSIQPAPEPAAGHIITVPGAQYRISHADFLKLCDSAFITAERGKEHFVPTQFCKDTAAHIGS